MTSPPDTELTFYPGSNLTLTTLREGVTFGLASVALHAASYQAALRESERLMKPKFRRPSPAMVVACLALFVASTGTSIAASHYLITSTKQIKPSVIKVLKGAKGPAGQSVTGLTGPQGPKGDTGTTGATGATGVTGAAGAAGAQGPSGVVTTAAFNGATTLIIGTNSNYVFIGNTATVTTTASQRLTGAAEVPLYTPALTNGQLFDFGLCYQPSTGGAISNFAGSNYSSAALYQERRSFAASASVVPGAGTWDVGFCVRNSHGNNGISSDWVNGWVQVTN